MSALPKHAENYFPDLPNEDDGERRLVASIVQDVGALGVQIADVHGFISTLDGQFSEQSAQFHALRTAASDMLASNRRIADAAGDAQSGARSVEAELGNTTDAVRSGLNSAVGNIRTLAAAAQDIGSSLGEIAQSMGEVRKSSIVLQSIATETQMLALNAGIESARAGEGGRGFAVIAQAVRHLADQARAAAQDNARRLEALVTVVADLDRKNRDNLRHVEQAESQGSVIEERLARFDSFGAQVRDLLGRIQGIDAPVQANISHCRSVIDDLTLLSEQVDHAGHDLSNANTRAECLRTISEGLIGTLADSGIRTPDSPLIDLCIEVAERIGSIFETAVQRGDIPATLLFDEAYMPVPNSAPQQHMTRFVSFTDRVLPPIQEATLLEDPRISFCAAVDRNGFLPTHNRQYSHPQGKDPVWNAANCRNRRLFNDRTGLAAGRNQASFLLQTYRRDMGGGVFVLMKDLSAPIMVQGRHWGGFRIGYRVE